MSEYVKLEEVMQVIENAAERPPTTREGTLSFAIDGIMKLGRVDAERDVDLVTVLAFEAGEKSVSQNKNYRNSLGVHEANCCRSHGCKYDDDACPVVLGVTEGENNCEECEGSQAHLIVRLRRGFEEISKHDNGNRYGYGDISNLCRYYASISGGVKQAVEDIEDTEEEPEEVEESSQEDVISVDKFNEVWDSAVEKSTIIKQMNINIDKVIEKLNQDLENSDGIESEILGEVLTLLEDIKGKKLTEDDCECENEVCCPRGERGEPGIPGENTYSENIENMFRESVAFLSCMAHKTARDKGWWPTESDPEIMRVAKSNLPKPLKKMLVKQLMQKNDGELISLMHSELSEALEALRHGNPPDDKIPQFPGVTAELADVFIRIIDYCWSRETDFAGAVLAKMDANRGREYKHGGKAF